MGDVLENFTLEELKDKFRLLMEISKCAVCLKSVQKKTVECHRGHLICSDCKGNLKSCPTCKSNFSLSTQCHFISRIREILPNHCKNRFCLTLLKRNDNHKKYCGFQYAKCKLCSWEGPAHFLYLHIFSKPEDLKIDHLDKKRTMEKFDKIKSVHRFATIIFPRDKFFWEETLNDPDTKMFTKTWHMVPNGKPMTDIFVTISFTSESGPFTSTKIKLNLDPDVPSNENSISIPHRILTYFINKSGTLTYSVVISNN